ncbi:hypothetical protein EDC01DRAFT_756865 [Geopyxis carbonaria]|nr:hypothetical protein EDC01DRAFT_756865 [Geopyxis carbonaria]
MARTANRPPLWIQAVLVFTSGLFYGARAVNCDVEPTALAFGNVTTLTYPDVYAAFRCFQIQVGDARKPLAVGFGTTHNATFISNSDNVNMCNSSSPGYKGCVWWRGGLYNINGSDSSFTKDMETFPNVNGTVSNAGFDFLNRDKYAAEQVDPISSFPRGWDQLSFGDKTIDGYPLSIIDNGSFPFSVGVIGMASDSVFLKMAVETKKIPSKSFGFDFGRTDLSKGQTAGELVLGGYNDGRVKSWKDSSNRTIFKDKDKPCPLQVTVKRMSWGKDSEYLDITEPFMACVEPSYHTTIMPLNVQKAWNETFKNTLDYKFMGWPTGATWEYLNYNKTKTSLDVPADDIVIELDDGFTVNIPSGEFWKPAKKPNDIDGGWTPIPGTISTFIGNAGFGDNEPLLHFLGGPFLSQVYLAVDYESNKFSLAHSTRPDTGNPPSELHQLGCDSASAATTTTAPKKSTSTGTIAGAAVGGVVGLALIAAGIFLFLRRRKQQHAATAVPTAPPANDSDSAKAEQQYAQSPGSPNAPPYDYAMSPVPTGWSPSTTTGTGGVSAMTPQQEWPAELPTSAYAAELGTEARSPTGPGMGSPPMRSPTMGSETMGSGTMGSTSSRW